MQFHTTLCSLPQTIQLLPTLLQQQHLPTLLLPLSLISSTQTRFALQAHKNITLMLLKTSTLALMLAGSCAKKQMDAQNLVLASQLVIHKLAMIVIFTGQDVLILQVLTGTYTTHQLQPLLQQKHQFHQVILPNHTAAETIQQMLLQLKNTIGSVMSSFLSAAASSCS